MVQAAAAPSTPKESLAIPVHVGIIMDGNGRWAQKRGLPRLAGHRAGTENVRRIVRACAERGVKVLTLYAFSTENWSRPPEEVEGLMNLAPWFIDRELEGLHKEGVRLRHLGMMEGISHDLQLRIRRAVQRTARNKGLVLNIAFNYGGRNEIVRAVRHIVRDGLPEGEISEATLAAYLDTAGLPDPDLVIRTAGEMRLSNFLTWQAAYSEFYSTLTYWPDFDKVELQKAFDAYGKRVRKFGALPDLE